MQRLGKPAALALITGHMRATLKSRSPLDDEIRKNPNDRTLEPICECSKSNHEDLRGQRRA